MPKLITVSIFICLIICNSLYADVPVKGNVKATGDVNITGKGDINVNKTIVNKGIPPEEYLRLAKEHGVTENAVKNFFKIIEQKEVPKEDWDATLRQIAKRHKELQSRLKQFNLLVDPEIQELRNKAEQAISNGDYGMANTYLDNALDRQMICINNAEKQLNNCKLSAAEITVDKGDIEVINFNYELASTLFKKAVQLVPDDNVLKKTEYLQKWIYVSKKTGLYKTLTKHLKKVIKLIPDDNLKKAEYLQYIGEAAYYEGLNIESQTALEQSYAIRKKLLKKINYKITGYIFPYEWKRDVYGWKGLLYTFLVTDSNKKEYRIKGSTFINNRIFFNEIYRRKPIIIQVNSTFKPGKLYFHKNVDRLYSLKITKENFIIEGCIMKSIKFFPSKKRYLKKNYDRIILIVGKL